MEVEVVCCLFQPSVTGQKIPFNRFLRGAQEENDCAVSWSVSRKRSAWDFTRSVRSGFSFASEKLKISLILCFSWKSDKLWMLPLCGWSKHFIIYFVLTNVKLKWVLKDSKQQRNQETRCHSLFDVLLSLG